MPLFRPSLKLLMLIALLAAIALQPVSVAVSSMLGQRHVHREPVSVKIWLGLTGNWHGTPRTVRRNVVADVGHAHLHSLALRHHHDIDDRSVVALEPPTTSDGSPVDRSLSPTASFAFVADRGVELPSVLVASATDWQKLELLPIASQPPRRIERPPNCIA